MSFFITNCVDLKEEKSQKLQIKNALNTITIFECVIIVIKYLYLSSTRKTKFK